MCGRYLIDDEAYADILQILNDINAAKERTNMDNITRVGNLAVGGGLNENLLPGEFSRGEIFPTYIAPVIENDRDSGDNSMVAIKWGFPHWKNTGVIINARSETALEKKMFGKAMRERRCVVPSGGFFEWGHRSAPSIGKRKPKDKYLFRKPGDHMLYMAGIISTFRDDLGVEYAAYVILTTDANEYVSSIHDRMPVILSSDEIDLWTKDDAFMVYAIQRPGPELSSVLSNKKENEFYGNILN